MAYRLKLKEPLEAGTRRIAAEQFDKILAGPETLGGRANWVHETRRVLKRTRALLRLVRSGLPPQQFQDENGALREIGRNLSAMRDRDVLAATLGKLDPTSARGLAPAITWMAAAIKAPVNGSSVAVGDDECDTAVRDALTRLQAARERLSEIEIKGERIAVLSDGLATTQRAGRKALRALAEMETEEALHDVRKRVQTYQRQMALILNAWPELQEVRVEAARQVARQLGEAQDFTVLAAAAAARRGTPGHRAHANLLVTACRASHQRCREEAIPKAERLFALPPEAVGSELSRLWTAAIAATAAVAKPGDAPSPPARSSRRKPA